MSSFPAITGKQLLKLFLKDGWAEKRRTRHCVCVVKADPAGRTRVAMVDDTRAVLPDGTLHDILGVKQTGIGPKRAYGTH
jgi:predicted RNA binding protein YcfA (HicA-like mRNA interferase family)